MRSRKYLFTTAAMFVFILTAFLFSNCGNTGGEKMTADFQDFLKDYHEKVIPLSRKLNLAYFNATTTGKDEHYKEYEKLGILMSKIHSDKEAFSRVKKIYESGTVTDPILKRQLEVIYHSYLDKQIDEAKLEKMIAKQTAIEQKFSTFRARIGTQEFTDNEIEEILKSSKSSAEVREAWLASKQVGQAIAGDVLELVRMRNAAAKALGFSNYHAMQLELSEQDPQQIEKLFDELDDLTRDAFAGVKNKIDEHLAKRFRISKAELMPWHYQNRFFQEAPKIYSVDLDQFYRDKDVVKIAEKFYAGIALPIDDLVKNSDLYEREGKYQHAYCTDIDREGDVRVVCNVKPNYGWMSTVLHEFGHAVYDKYHDRSLAWVIREPAHAFTTEAIAILFERQAANPQWMRHSLGISEAEVRRIKTDCYNSLRLERLVFSRWAQVMYRFEKRMYENPDQDLNKLWWDLVEKYQMIRRPANRNQPDWAAKIHVALYPAYYHNYLMGDLLASQLQHYINENVLGEAADSMVARAEVGQYLSEKVFKPGSKYTWNEMIRQATGEPLTARYFARQYVNAD